MTRDRMPGTDMTRRALLAGAGLAGLAGATAGCATIRSDAVAAARQEAANGDSTVAPASMAPAAGGMASPAAGTLLGTVSEIPVGGGKVFTAAQVVVTQPAAGQFRAFSAVCTHAQCLVDRVAMGTIDCPCHGSRFSVKDGSVAAGPAPSPLPPRKITEADGKITLA